MITDPDLAAAVDTRPHWQPTGPGAVYAPPGSVVSVRVQRMHQPTRREQYMATVVRDGRAAYTMPCHTAVEAVRLAERISPT